jgi:hypothetical protein
MFYGRSAQVERCKRNCTYFGQLRQQAADLLAESHLFTVGTGFTIVRHDCGCTCELIGGECLRMC